MERMRGVFCVAVLAIFFSVTDCTNKVENQIQAASPNGKIKIQIDIKEGEIFYSVNKDDQFIVKKSKLGFKFRNIPAMDNHFILQSSATDSLDQVWEQPWGETRYVRNHYHEVKLNLVQQDSLHRQLILIFRIFNDGIGFRYLFPEQPNLNDLIISDEETEFNLTSAENAWWIPVHSENSFYESLYRNTKIDHIDTANTPITIRTISGKYLAIHEANLTDYASMTLLRNSESGFKAELVPWSNGDKVYGKTPFVTPWRTIIIADTPGDLIISNLILNLNEPCQITDLSWIRPEKYIGIWWAMHQGIYTWHLGPKHGATTANTKKYIDFASSHKINGVLVEGWNLSWERDVEQIENFLQAYPDFDIAEICHYAAIHGVNLIGHNETFGDVSNYEKQIDSAFKMYHQLGIEAVKTGYVSQYLDNNEWHDGQFGVRHYRKVIEKAAKYKIMIDNHEPVKPTGLSRTFPNLMTQEGARGQEFDAWSPDGGNPPSHTTILPFTRMLGGPMDFTFGTFNFENKTHPGTRVQTTLAKQLALYVIIYSPLQMASDLIESYEGNRAFKFIEDVPCNWQETKVINASIGNYVSIARKDRNSEDWYLGSITNEDERTLSFPLNFLNKETQYTAEIYKDGADASWDKNPTSLIIEQEKITSSDSIQIKLATGGGCAIRFIPSPKF